MSGLSGIFGGSKKNTKPEFTALQLQTSASILAIPIVWGMARIAPNLLFYDGFTPIQTSGKDTGKGGALGSTSSPTTTTYRADLALALCEGPIHGIGLTWHDRLQYPVFGPPGGEGASYIPIWDSSTGTTSFLFIFEGGDPTVQFTWGYFAAAYPEFVLAFPWTAYLATSQFDLGSSATIGELNCEVQGRFYNSAPPSPDADPALVVQDFLTNVQYGAGFDPALIDLTTLLSASGTGATLQDYCKALGLVFSPALVDQEQASSILTRWLQIVNTAPVWSGAVLKFIPYGDTTITAGTIETSSVTLAIPGNPDNIPGGFGFGSIQVYPEGNFVADLGVKYVEGGNLIFAGATIPAGPGEYGLIGQTYYFNQYDIGAAVTITFQWTNLGSYTPNLTPIFSLTDDDYVDGGGNDDPITIERVDPYTLPTVQRVEVLSRNNQYASVPVEARDQSQIELLGLRVGTTISAHEICDEIVVGPIVAQLILQRGLYVRANYKFKTDWTFCMLDPMDIIALNDPVLELDNYPVRIVSIEEDDNGLLQFNCEELPSGIATAPLYTNAGVTSTVFNQSIPAFAIN